MWYHEPMDTLTVLLFVLPGMIGGLVRGLVGIGKHVLKEKEEFKIHKLAFSLIVAMIVGAIAAAVSNGDWRISLLAGYAGSDLIESLYKSRLLGLLTGKV